jgi:pilus assembly protein CpaE
MMSTAMRVLVALDEGVDRQQVEEAVSFAGQVEVTGIVDGLDKLDAIVGDSNADLLVIAAGWTPDAALSLIGASSAERPQRPIVVLCEHPPEHFVHQAFRAGADDVVPVPETAERVAFALQKALARHPSRDAAGSTKSAPMICVLGPKGGTGKTVTASNLTVSLAEAGKRSVVMDLDLQFGDMGLALGLTPERTVYDLATSGGALDAEKLEAYLVTHESNARALLAPVRPDQASAISIDLLRDVYALLRSNYDYVVVDTPPDFTPEVIGAIDASSHVCIVGMLDSLSLKDTKLGLETLDLMGYDSSAITLVLNRADSHVGLTRDDVEQVIGRAPDVLVPSDRNVPVSLNEGVPIVLGKQRSDVAAAYRSLTSIYLPGEVSRNGVPKQRRRGLFRRRRRES